VWPARTPVPTIDRRADISVLGHASRLWIKLIPGGIQRRVDGISKRFTSGAGWNNIPQELVDEILDYLLDDLLALKACSLTCKHLFGATRPLIHQRLVCSDSWPLYPKSKRLPFSRRKRESGAFDRLIHAGRSGILPYAQCLTFKPRNDPPSPGFNPRDMQKCLPLLQSITGLHTLTLGAFHLHPFIPVFDEYFGMFTNTLRHLDIRNAHGTEQELLYIICQFPLLENLTIVSPARGIDEHPGHPVPLISRSPPLRGKLILVHADSREFLDSLAGIPCGLSFRSMVVFGCGGDLWPVLAACRHNLTSISYLWPPKGNYSYSESTSSTQVYTAV